MWVGTVSGAEAGLHALWLYALQIAAFAGAAGFLVLRASDDKRAVNLGVVFLLIATSYSRHPISILTDWAPGSLVVAFVRHLHVDAFLPGFLWLFFRDFPRAITSLGLRRLTRTGVAASFGAGVVLFSANLVLFGTGEVLPALGRLDPLNDTSVYWAIVYGLTVLAVPVALWRARTAPAEERRRLGLFVTGMAVAAVPVSLFILGTVVRPGFARWAGSPSVWPLLDPVIQALILSIPITTAYAVLVDRVIDVRVILRTAFQYGFARTAVASVAALPFLWVGWYLYRARGETLIDLMSGTRPLLLCGVLVVGFTGLRLRRRVETAVNRLFFRDQYDARQILIGLSERIRFSASVDELGELLTTEIERALHLESITLLVSDSERGVLRAPSGGLRPLDVSSELAFALSAADSPVSIDLESPGSPMRGFPEADQQWLADGAVQLLVPLLSPRRELIGALALGEKRSELAFSGEDRELLSAIASSGGLTLENLRMRGVRDAGAPAAADKQEEADRLRARECPTCMEIHPSEARVCPRCRVDLTPLPLPYVLFGKFRLERRVGKGGMGVVYRALDLTLRRPVAIKTLPRTSPEDSVRLRREARAMAAVVHPNLALVYGAESWEGTPLLIFEFLEGGTLADRLERAPLSPREVVQLGVLLADVLDRAHGAGILHRDVKPSNVGYTDEGVPKLLDFGLARMVGDALTVDARAPVDLLSGPLEDPHLSGLSILRTAGLVGTPLYMSPEALLGEPPDASYDLWGLAVVLYEAIARKHPFERSTWADTLDAMQRAPVPHLVEVQPRCPKILAEFLENALSRDRRRRPPSAREFRQGLERLAV